MVRCVRHNGVGAGCISTAGPDARTGARADGGTRSFMTNSVTADRAEYEPRVSWIDVWSAPGGVTMAGLTGMNPREQAWAISNVFVLARLESNPSPTPRRPR